MSMNARNRLLLLGLAGLAIAIVVVMTAWNSLPKRDILTPSARPETGMHADSLQGNGAQVPRAVGVQQGEIPVGLSGRVLDDVFSVPVVARITTSTGRDTYSSASTGSFDLSGEHAIPEYLRASAPGYSVKEILGSDIERGQSIEIRLTSSASAKIVVQDEDHNPIQSAPVEWAAEAQPNIKENASSWIYSLPAEKGRILRKLTDAQGQSKLAIGCISRVAVTDPRTNLKMQVRIKPGEERVIVLSSKTIQVRVADEMNKPLSDLHLVWWMPLLDGSTASEASTDAEGLVHLPIVSFPVLLRSAGGEMWQKQWTALSRGVSVVGIGGKLRSVIRVDASVNVATTLEVRVASCAGQIRIVNADSGNRISGLARLVATRQETGEEAGRRPTRSTVSMPLDATDDVWGTYVVENGILDVPCTLLDLVNLPAGQQQRQIALAVRGFVPVRILPSDIPWDSAAPPLEVGLKSVAQRSLRIAYADRQPCREPVRIYCPSLDAVVWREAGRNDGLQGPFEWGGGELVVCVGDDESWSLAVPAASLASQEVVDVTLAVATGSIVIEGVPVGAIPSSLVAKLGVGLGGTVFRPTVISGSECRFEALSPGHYCVGPAEWVAGAELQSVGQELGSVDLKPHASRAWVEPGKTTRLAWSAAWEAGRRIEGCITANGTRPKGLFLVPLYGPIGPKAEEGAGGTPRMVFGRRAPTIPLNEDGCYVIGEHDPFPRLLSICALDDGTWGSVQGLHALQTLMPGESVNLELGSLEFSDDGRRVGDDRRVRFCLTGESRRYPLASFHECSENTWYGGSVLHLDNVPTEVDAVTVGRVSIPVHIRAGEISLIKMNGDSVLEGQQGR